MVKESTKFDIYVYTNDSTYFFDNIDTHNCSMLLHFFEDTLKYYKIFLRYSRNGKIVCDDDIDVIFNYSF